MEPEIGATPQVGTRAVRGAFVLTAASYIALVLGVAARKWLAILLAPAIFGIIQTAISFVDLILSFASFSFSSAIVNVRENLLKEPLEFLNENIYVLTVCVNGILAIAAISIGALFVHDLGGTLVLALIGIYAVQRFTAAIDTFYTQMLERRLVYSRVAQVTLLTNIVLHVGSIAIALAGWGAWSIPCATFISTLVSFVLDRRFVRLAGIHTIHPAPWRYWRPKTAKWLWKFGTHVLFNRLFESWLFRVDNLLVLAFLGTAMLGYYSQAFAIAQMPAIALAPIVARVSIATYAEIQHDRAKLEEAFAVTNFFLVRLAVPATLIMIFASKDIVRLFLSSSWGASGAPLAALAGFVLTIPLFENGKMLLGAKLRLREISVVRATQLVVLVLGIVLVGKTSVVRVGLIVSAVSVGGYGVLAYFVRKEVSLRVNRIYALPTGIGLVAGVILFLVEPLSKDFVLAGSTIGMSLLHGGLVMLATLLLTTGVELAIAPAPILNHIRLVGSRIRSPNGLEKKPA